MSQPQPQTDLINQLFRTVEVLGLEKTHTVLVEAMTEKVVFTDKKVEYVVTTICGHFNVPVAEVIYGNGRKNDRKYVIAFCSYYLFEIYKYDIEAVSANLKKDVTLCHKYKKMIRTLNDHHVSDRKYLNFKKELDKLFAA